MCALYAFSLLLLGWGLAITLKGEAAISRRRSTGVTLRGRRARALGIAWMVIGASSLLVAFFSGAAVRLVSQLSDELRFLVGVVRGVSQCTVVAGILVFLLTMLVLLFSPGGEKDDGDEKARG